MRILVSAIVVPAILFRVAAWAGPAPDLRGRFSGTYDRGASAEPFTVEVEKQHKHMLTAVSVFAENEAELQGHGAVAADGVTVTVMAHTAGAKKFRRRIKLVGTLGAGGATIDGTYTLHGPHGSPLTGAFSVGR